MNSPQTQGARVSGQIFCCKTPDTLSQTHQRGFERSGVPDAGKKVSVLQSKKHSEIATELNALVLTVCSHYLHIELVYPVVLLHPGRAPHLCTKKT